MRMPALRRRSTRTFTSSTIRMASSTSLTARRRHRSRAPTAVVCPTRMLAFIWQGFNTIGEWSMDKRHYGQAYPPQDGLDPPPERANPSTKWLHAAWHEAVTNEPDWPDTNA